MSGENVQAGQKSLREQEEDNGAIKAQATRSVELDLLNAVQDIVSRFGCYT